MCSAISVNACISSKVGHLNAPRLCARASFRQLELSIALHSETESCGGRRGKGSTRGKREKESEEVAKTYSDVDNGSLA